MKELDDSEIFLAGEQVKPGLYFQLEGSRKIIIEEDDFLPASLDGRVACYRRGSAMMQQELLVKDAA